MRNFLRIHKTLGTHSGAIYAISDGPNDVFFTAGADNIVGAWHGINLVSHDLSIKLDHSIFSLSHCTDSNMLFIGNSIGGVHWIDLDLKKEVKHFTLHKKGVYALRVKNGILYSGDGNGLIAEWDIGTQTMTRHFPISTEKIRYIDSSADGEDLAVCCGDGVIHVLDQNLNERLTLEGHDKSVNTVKITTSTIISGGWDGHLRLWDRFTGELLNKIPAHNYAIYDMLVLEDQHVLITASRDKSIKIWGLDNLTPIQKIDNKSGGHQRSVNRLLHIENKVFSSGDDGKVLCWSIE